MTSFANNKLPREMTDFNGEDSVNTREHDPRPPFPLVCHFVSDLKLDKLLYPGTLYTGQHIILKGDVLRLETPKGGKNVQIIELVPGNSHMNGGVRIAIPPSGHATSQAHLDVVLPAHGASLAGPIPIMQAIASVDPFFGFVTGKWDTFTVVRGEQVLSSLGEIRQAYQWGINEIRFTGQLQFRKIEKRRLNAKQKQNGYVFINQSSLYRKILTSHLANYNHDLIIDLGLTLNAELSAIAPAGYEYVMYDNRILSNDGYPRPSNTSDNDAYMKGASCFATQFLRDIAGRFGDSSGHAHLGPVGLGKGIDAYVGQNSFGSAAAPETAPRSFKPTAIEISLLRAFHSNKICGQIRHHPLPVTYSKKWAGAQQLRIKPHMVSHEFWDLQNWQLDTQGSDTLVIHSTTPNVPIAPAPLVRRPIAVRSFLRRLSSTDVRDPTYALSDLAIAEAAKAGIDPAVLDPRLFE